VITRWVSPVVYFLDGIRISITPSFFNYINIHQFLNLEYYFFLKILPCINCGTFCTMGIGYFPGVKRPGRVADQPATFYCQVATSPPPVPINACHGVTLTYFFFVVMARKGTPFRAQVFVAYKNIFPTTLSINFFQSMCEVITAVFLKIPVWLLVTLRRFTSQLQMIFFLELLDTEVSDRIIRNVQNY
jgi:hypothetical protein